MLAGNNIFQLIIISTITLIGIVVAILFYFFSESNNRRKNIITICIAGVSFLVFGISVFNLLGLRYADNKNAADMAQLREQVMRAQPVPVYHFDDETETTKIEFDMSLQSGNEPEINVDMIKLMDMYPNAVAWIEIPSCNISYPVMQYEDNEYYLDHSPDGANSKSGSIFLEASATADFRDSNSFIYGHNMNTNINQEPMFGTLKDLRNNPELVSDNPFIYVTTRDGIKKTYQIISYHLTTSSDPLYRIPCSMGDYLEYIDEALSVSMKQIVSCVDTEGNPPIITLSTCVKTGTNQRFLVHAIQIS